ncbi:hypothetical protein LH462_13525 [Laribacter hongkongensis]|uniref:SPOR domain-containing protein n=1 Tax=Laribacter hongkongensis TaxID=168471 RepID=A0AAW5DLK9_9NEIS|nr:hypothetical protein [Laribacter hongkongensis]MCG8996056.1 hypothetical protein [Laribacter hongkongensis]MCG9011290.1 hypothetical protein [Laribacter hongkongensis]MCG9024088.1 hypothetical protein [Laribacter hongkongensis]MCG9025031.1 hypothetical protein [Laribacter hongkongensis]MCG9048074.1 hypothetical protein [Laribacter hongkongensis]
MRGYVIEKMSLGELPRWYVLNEQPPRQPVAGPFDTEEAAQAEALRLAENDHRHTLHAARNHRD